MIQPNNQKKPSVTVGIPAYNEEANVKHLIEALLKQDQSNFELSQIIVADDASTDNTVKEARSISDPRVLVLSDENRSGQYFRQNQVIEHFTGDILVLLNADMLPATSSTISNLIEVFKDPAVGLASGRISPLPPNTFFERVINYSVEIKDYIASQINGGRNILHCRGAYRGFSKKFLEKFKFEKVVNEDAYTYLWCINNGFRFEFVGDSVINYRSPNNFRDHKRQSLRFVQGQEGLMQYFDKDQVIREHDVPASLLIKSAFKFFFKNPVLFTAYFYFYAKVRLLKNQTKEAKIRWNAAESTKRLIRGDEKTGRKIEIVCTYFHPVLAGLEINVLNTYSYFVKNKWEVIVHTTKDDVDKKNVYSDIDEINGIKIKRTSYLSFGFLPFSLGIDYRSEGILAVHDFMTFPGIFICFYTWFLKLTGRKKYTFVLTSHGLFSYGMKGVYPGLRMRIKKAIDYTLGVYLINRSVDIIRTVSEQEKGYMVKAGVRAQLIEVIGNGIEEVAYRHDIDQAASENIKKLVSKTGDYALEVARIDPLKNLETLIRAFVNIESRLKLVIVGPDQNVEYKNELNKLIHDLNLKDRVIFTGRVTGVDKYFLMKHSKVFVHLPKAEGFGNVVHEAMSQGCICIVSKGTALEELIRDGENGYRLDSADYKGLAERINRIINSPNIPEMRQKNVELTRNHSWSDIAKKVESLYLKDNRRAVS